MAWYNPFSWGEETSKNVFDKDNGLLQQVGDWIGGQQFTDEEKAEDNREVRQGVIAYAIASLGENSERSKARRYIATTWIKVQLVLILLCAIAAPWRMDLAEFYFKLGSSAIMLAGTSAVMTFFFGSYILRQHHEAKGKK